MLVPLYPSFITLSGAPVPGISVVPKALTVALLALAGVMAAYWASRLLAAPKRPMPTVPALAAFPAAALVAACFGFDPLAGALFIVILVFAVVWHATILRFFHDPGVAETIFGSYLLSGALASLAAIAMVLAKTPVSLYTIGHGRAIGTFVLPGELAGYLIIYVPVAYALARTQLTLRPLTWIGLTAASIAFVLTFSRAGWIGMAAALAAFVVLRWRRSGARYAVGIVGIAVAAVGLVFNAHHDPSENFTRLSIWNGALHMVQRFPFSGVGPFEFPRMYQLVRMPGGEAIAYHAHSVILTVAAWTGIVGVVALCFGWWRFAVELRGRLTAAAYDSARVPIAIAAGLFGTWVQGLIDTISVVIFGLWLPFMALALATANGTPPERPSTAGPAVATVRTRRVTAGAIAAIAVLCAVVQTASSSVFAAAASSDSLPARLPPEVGTRLYEAIERVAPVPFVEIVLAEDALRRGDLTAASRSIARIPAGPSRSDLQARVASAHGDTAAAVRLFLEAGDDEALQPLVAAAVQHDRIREAYALESRIRDRLAAAGTRPNALADSWWRLGRLAVRLGNRSEAASDYGRASDLAPLNTKYRLDAGVLALERNDAAASSLFARVADIDPSDADAIAGMGLAALERGDAVRAAQFASRADVINSHATLARKLQRSLRGRSPQPVGLRRSAGVRSALRNGSMRGSHIT